MSETRKWFLGANAPEGFYSLYDEFVKPERGRIYILKGGPGCGKSSFMRRIQQAAQQAGLETEQALCSGDPDSLDGVYLPEPGIGYVDGTAPHVLEPVYPGASGLYLDLSQFYDADALTRKREDIAAATAAYRAVYGRAYHLLSAAGETRRAARAPYMTPALRSAAASRAERLAGWLTPGRAGTETRRFLTAVTCRGPLSLWDTLSALTPSVCLLDNGRGLAAGALRLLTDRARALGLERIICPDPLEPSEPQCLILPDAGLSFLSQSPEWPWPERPWRSVRLDALPDSPDSVRTECRASRKLCAGLVAQAAEVLAEANRLHGALETLYNPHVDFDGVYGLAESHIARILARL